MPCLLLVGSGLPLIDEKHGCELFSLVKRHLKFADVSHYGIEIGFPAKVHFSHFLVVPAEDLFELGAGRKAKSSLLGEFISRTALAEKVLLMLHDLYPLQLPYDLMTPGWGVFY